MRTPTHFNIFQGDGAPTSNPDPDASYSLLRSLQIQSGELIGQLLILIRLLLSRYQHCLDQFKTTQQPNQKKRSAFICSFEPLSQVPSKIQQHLLLNGVHFLIRFVWLLRSSSGDFLSRVLNSSTVHLKSLSRHQHYQYMTTIEQIISAFDIADTDGDGSLNWNEALEAVEALWIDPSMILTGKSGEDDMNESSEPINFDFLWYDAPTLQCMETLGLTFTLEDFRLVCSQMIAPPSHASPSTIEIPTVCLQRSLESLLSTATLTMKSEIVTYFRESYRSGLTSSFPVSDLITNQPFAELFSSSPEFRSKWKVRLAALESDAETDELTEQVTIPCSPTNHVSSLLRYLSNFLHHTSLSIDTTHRTHDPIHVPSHLHNVPPSPVQVSTLWDFLRTIYSASCRAMIDEELHSHFKTVSEFVSTSSKFQQHYEDYALQIVYDLNILHSSLAADSSSSSPSSSFSCYDLFYNSIDPVNISFLEPFLLEESTGYLSRYHLLLPGVETRQTLNQQLLENVGKGHGGLQGQIKAKHDARSEELLRSVFVSSGQGGVVVSESFKKGTSEASSAINRYISAIQLFSFLHALDILCYPFQSP